MMKRIKLESRYKDVETYCDFIDDNTAILSTTGYFVRCILGVDNKTIKSIDFEGGPMISVGDSIEGIDKKIKSIKTCYYVELE